MKRRLPSEFLYQVFALLFAVIVVHAAYVGVIRPSADSQLAIQAAQQAAGEAPTGNRSLAIVIKDYEQEACFILLLWALAIMGLKAARTRSEVQMLDRELIAIPDGTSILPRDAREQSRSLEALPADEQDYLLPRALGNALSRLRQAAYPPSPTRCASSAILRQIDLTLNFPWCAISPGPFHPSALSALSAVLAMHWVRPTRPWRAIFPA